MVDVKITGLTNFTGNLADVDLFEMVDDPTGTPTSYKVAASKIKDYVTNDVDDIVAEGSAGLALKNSGGTSVLTIGAGGGTGASFANGVTIAGQLTASANFVFDGVTHTGTTGSDVTLVSGTAGTSGNLAQWNADGDLVDASIEVANVLQADVADVLTAGFATTPHGAGTKSSGTFTPDEADGNKQYIINGGAFTLAPPVNDTNIELFITNNGSAGAITTSGFDKVTGDSFTTTDTHKFWCTIRTIDDGTTTYSHLDVMAMQ